jgi:Right handed beta helix region/Pectinesterase
MNTQNELDRIIRDWLDDRVAEPRQAGLDAVLDRTTTTPQHRRRWLERWLRRGTSATRSARARGSPPDIDDSRRNRIMLSATGIVGTIVVLALAATLVLPADRVRTPIGPGAGTGATHVVAQDGSGDFATITEAVDAAADGDVVMVKPGRYVETVTITKDITLAGDGPRDEIVIENPPGGPTAELEHFSQPEAGAGQGTAPHFTLLVDEADAIVSGLTVSGPATGGITVILHGGAPTVDDVAVVLDGPGGTWGAWAALYIVGESLATISSSSFDGFTKVEGGASATFDASVHTGRVSIDGPGRTVLRGNTFRDNTSTGNGGVDVNSGAIVLVEAADFEVGSGGACPAGDVTAYDYVVGGRGIEVLGAGTNATITGSTFSTSCAGIIAREGAEATIEGNTITGGLVGLDLRTDAARVEANSITGADVGISVIGTATPTLAGNTLCDNGTDLRVDEGNPTTLEGNEVCPADASPAASG